MEVFYQLFGVNVTEGFPTIIVACVTHAPLVWVL
jgi:hypothetical protein